MLTMIDVIQRKCLRLHQTLLLPCQLSRMYIIRITRHTHTLDPRAHRTKGEQSNFTKPLPLIILTYKWRYQSASRSCSRHAR